MVLINVPFAIFSGIISLIAGIIILVWPRSLNLIVGLWLIINGILALTTLV